MTNPLNDETLVPGVELTAALPEVPPTVPGDAHGLERVLANLLTNALRHTPKGGWGALELTGKIPFPSRGGVGGCAKPGQRVPRGPGVNGGGCVAELEVFCRNPSRAKGFLDGQPTRPRGRVAD